MSEGGPSPRTFVAKATTVMLEEFLHREEEISNQSVQIPLSQVEATRVDESHILPEMESI